MPTGENARVSGAGMVVHSAEDKQEALELYTLHGATEASRRTGIPHSTISHWAADADLAPKREEVAAGLRATYAMRKLAVADELLGDVEKLREQTSSPTKVGHWHEGEYHEAEIPEPTFDDKRQIAWTIGKYIDKAQDLVEGRRANSADAGTITAVQVIINRESAT